MSKTAYVFLMDGFEEIEAITPIDLMRRAGINVKTVSLVNDFVKGGHNILVKADIVNEKFVLPEDADMVILPGGGTGTDNLLESKVVEEVLKTANERNIFIAAICAAPKVLYKYGLLDAKKTAAYPSVRNELVNAEITEDAIAIDGKIITGRAAGTSIAFAHCLIEVLCGKEKADNVVNLIYP